uniref:Large ribosomal subunit protein P2 n=1 Tax=Pectinaria gouldii TaxID=260746 RepID=A1Z2Q4_PECGU|nr:hypothetical protein [Pectinaria gouldii]
MRYVAAYLLAALGGNNNVDAKAIKGILGSVGIDADDEKLNKVIAELKGKDIAEVIAADAKLASVPSGGAVAASGGAPLPVEPPLLLKPRRRRRRRSPRKSLMTTWALASSTRLPPGRG